MKIIATLEHTRLGQHLFNVDYHGNDKELPKFIDFKGYGTRYMNNNGSCFTSLGYVQCNDSLDEILSYACDEPQGGMTMGGMYNVENNAYKSRFARYKQQPMGCSPCF